MAMTVALSVNHLLGLGILCLPWAMVRAGLVLSGLALLIVTALALLSAQWLVETTARGQALIELNRRTQDRATEMELLVHKVRQS